MAFINEQLDERNWQTIDHERGIVLECTKPGGSSAMFGFSLTIKNEEAIKFEALQRIETVIRVGNHIHWILHHIYIPASFTYAVDEIKQLIAEALDAYGFAGASRKNVLSVEVNTNTHSISRS